MTITAVTRYPRKAGQPQRPLTLAESAIGPGGRAPAVGVWGHRRGGPADPHRPHGGDEARVPDHTDHVTTCDKILVTHSGALRRKYGADGGDRVRDALDGLVAADSTRGIVNRVLDLDNYQSMKAVGATRVPDGDWVATLRAADLACTRYAPAYVALVGATDAVPQARVDNPFAGLGDDLDPYVPSDLPFACDLPDDGSGPLSGLDTGSGTGSLLDPADLLAMTRVVGRIPDLAGESDPALLLDLLATATSYTQRSAGSYQRVFALTAAAWHGSTTQSATLLPGPTPPVNDSPPATSGWNKSVLAPRVHLVNCHGADTAPDWFGQLPGGPVDTVALTPEDVEGRLTDGTVVAAECCFGAMHQVPSRQSGRRPMLAAYLHSGAYAAVGSSTTSYGPADGNGQADLICRFFLENVVAGFSNGRALLEARQRFVREGGALAPEDLKTLAQFDLLGDPSLHAVSLAAPKGPAVTAAVTKSARHGRRVALAATGRALEGAVPRAGRRQRRPRMTAERLAERAGVRTRDVGQVRSFGEHRRGPRRGNRFFLAPVRVGRRSGFVSGRELDGVLDARVVLRK